MISLPRSRLLWLLSVLAMLTLFFAFCGWRNWHLSNSEDEIWLALPAYYLSSPAPTTRLPTGLVIMSEPPPFGAGQVTLLSRWNSAQSKFEPVPVALFRELQQRYPLFRLRNWSNFAPDSYRDNQRYFFIHSVHFQNKFAATCHVTFRSRAPHMAQFGTTLGVFTLTRSPSPFRDTQWHVAEWRWLSFSMG